MEERIDKIDTLLADVAAYLVEKYGLSARDAAGIVMTSAIAEQLYKLDSELENYNSEEIAEMLQVA